MATDTTFWMYVITGVVALYGFGLFMWWRLYSTKPSDPMFWYVMFLLFGTAVSRLLGAYARHLRLNGVEEQYIAFMSGPLWMMRTSIIAVCVIGIAAHGTTRYFWQTRSEK